MMRLVRKSTRRGLSGATTNWVLPHFPCCWMAGSRADEHMRGTHPLLMSMSKRLLPLIPAGLTVVQVLPTPDRVNIVARPLAEAALCPDCGAPSRRLHSHYERRLFDLTCHGRPVALQVQARRFRCLAPSCPRQTFAERLTGVAALAARRTERLGAVQRCLGFALGGCLGSRLAERLAMPVSADTLRRMVVRAAAEAQPSRTPRVLAVDDWAKPA